MATYTFKITNGDVVMGADGGLLGGGLEVVTGSEKFAQDVRGLIRTERSGIPQAIGKEGNPFEIRSIITQYVTRAFEAFKNVQRSRQYSKRGRDERFAALSRVDVAPRANDPRRYVIAIETLSEQGLATRTRV